MTTIKTDGSPAPGSIVSGKTADIQVSQPETIKVCPECGGPLVFGSEDPCEGVYKWCGKCGFGPILFPLSVPATIARQDEALDPIIDAEEFNIRLRRGKVLRTFYHRSSGCIIEEVAL